MQGVHITFFKKILVQIKSMFVRQLIFTYKLIEIPSTTTLAWLIPRPATI